MNWSDTYPRHLKPFYQLGYAAGLQKVVVRPEFHGPYRNAYADAWERGRFDAVTPDEWEFASGAEAHEMAKHVPGSVVSGGQKTFYVIISNGPDEHAQFLRVDGSVQ